MTSLRTSPIRLAAAIIGSAIASSGSVAFTQEIPLVRPSAEVFGDNSLMETGRTRSSSPFSVLDPDWQTANAGQPKQLPPFHREQEPAPVPKVEPAANLVQDPAPQLEIDLPVVNTSAAKLASPVREVPSLPILKAPETREIDEPPAYTPKPAIAKAGTKATADDLEGMLHNMVWVTGTIGLGAVVSLWMLRLWLTRGGRIALPAKSLRLVDTLRIGPRCGVYLVEAESHRVLVGVEHGKTMCLMPLPASFSDTLEAASDEPEHLKSASGFERVADVFTAMRKDEKSKGATS